MKRMKEKTPQRQSGGIGCLPFLLVIIAIAVILGFTQKNIKKDFGYFTRGEADIGMFFTDIKKSYDANMTYPDFIMPLGGNVTSPFGDRINPITNQPEKHTGIDIDVNAGLDVLASADGKVLRGGQDERFGNYIIVEHSSAFVTCYAHLEEILKKDGDQVKRGEKIGIAGETGLSTGKHLHFEIRKNEERVNPLNYINNQ
jgi:murein DD-endopeptidase MepM/ murein hydrolase activator NlpD